MVRIVAIGLLLCGIGKMHWPMGGGGFVSVKRKNVCALLLATGRALSRLLRVHENARAYAKTCCERGATAADSKPTDEGGTKIRLSTKTREMVVR